MDGSFRIDGIPVGDYYAGAVMPGYLTPGTSIATETATAEQLKDLLDSMPTVHVTAGQVASVSLTLHRGAVIAGRLQFADGSPAVGAKVGWELAERDIEIQSVRMTRLSPAQEILSTFGYHPRQDNGIETDDEGRYRIYGLPAGKYIVSTVIISPLSSGQVTMNDGTSTRASGQVRMYPNMTAVYAPGVFRRKDAKVFEVREGEQRMDADMKLDPSGGVHGERQDTSRRRPPCAEPGNASPSGGWKRHRRIRNDRRRWFFSDRVPSAGQLYINRRSRRRHNHLSRSTAYPANLPNSRVALCGNRARRGD